MEFTKDKGFGIVWSTTLTKKMAALDVQIVVRPGYFMTPCCGQAQVLGQAQGLHQAPCCGQAPCFGQAPGHGQSPGHGKPQGCGQAPG